MRKLLFAIITLGLVTNTYAATIPYPPKLSGDATDSVALDLYLNKISDSINNLPSSFTDSIQNVSGTVNLVGDTASPGNTMMYGTNGSGVRGWYTQPAGTTPSSLVINYQSITTNTTPTSKIQSGWSFVTGDGTNTQYTITITYPVAFSTIRYVTANLIAYKDGSDPTSITDITGGLGLGPYQTFANSPSTTQMTVYAGRGDATPVTNGRRLLFNWLATGD